MNAKDFEDLFDYVSYNHFYKYTQTEMFDAEQHLRRKLGEDQDISEEMSWIWLEERRKMKFQKLFRAIDWKSHNVKLFVDLLIYNK